MMIKQKHRLLNTLFQRVPLLLEKSHKSIPNVFLEIIAQAAAAQHGFNLKRDKKEDERGLLVGVREFNIYNSAFVNDKLTITIECGTEIASLSIVEGSIKNANLLIATATITVWHGK